MRVSAVHLAPKVRSGSSEALPKKNEKFSLNVFDDEVIEID